MKKSDKNKIFGNDNNTFAYKLTMILVIISIVVSGVLTGIMNKKSLMAFSDNMFIIGVLLSIISIIFNLIKNIYAFMKKELFPLGQVLSRIFLIAGITNTLISIIFAFLA